MRVEALKRSEKCTGKTAAVALRRPLPSSTRSSFPTSGTRETSTSRRRRRAPACSSGVRVWSEEGHPSIDRGGALVESKAKLVKTSRIIERIGSSRRRRLRPSLRLPVVSPAADLCVSRPPVDPRVSIVSIDRRRRRTERLTAGRWRVRVRSSCTTPSNPRPWPPPRPALRTRAHFIKREIGQ